MKTLGSLEDNGHYKAFKSVSDEVAEIVEKYHIKISLKHGNIILHLPDETLMGGVWYGKRLYPAYHLPTGEILVYKNEQINIASPFDLERLS